MSMPDRSAAPITSAEADPAAGRMAELCRTQAELCARLGSELYAGLLARCAEDVAARGPVWTVLRDLAGCPAEFYPALRLLGSVHRLVLDGRAPVLAAHYPSVGGRPGPGLWEAFHTTVVDRASELAGLVTKPPQTNEVGRSAGLLGGFLLVARETGLPLRLLEIGASAGLNLGWDRYRYESGGWSWGDPASPVRITGLFTGATPAGAPVTVVERLGCDLNPIDPRTEDGRLTLLSYVWPDQTDRSTGCAPPSTSSAAWRRGYGSSGPAPSTGCGSTSRPRGPARPPWSSTRSCSATSPTPTAARSAR
ncbi:hypothetical protein SAMN05421810_106196 [Amycolatopsis arida]|uniref:DUF2332 domain-containing protein n=1 Tax=Amycolatopsis arida TaxID=587909 RepID=A0A1I5XQ16_9PSEU|nr:uncharacterized protein DUF2332 [Amycolatopsis arida]SFQ34053.1 hypothetical protein SAMN05421810_106196 [Amycolatopsis arida]